MIEPQEHGTAANHLTGPAAATGRHSRQMYLVLSCTIWLSVITLLVVADHRAVARLLKDTPESLHHDSTALQRQLDSLNEQMEDIRRRPGGVSESAYATDQASVVSRLTKLTQTAESSAPQSEVAELREQLRALELRLSEDAKRHSRPPKKDDEANVPPGQQRFVPPFAVLGVEIRGGERFLATAPPGVQSLSQVHLLRPGDTQDNWKLEALGANTADFLVDGHVQHIAFP
jgi:hypothetical protein